jgi:arylsulfatase
MGAQYDRSTRMSSRKGYHLTEDIAEDSIKWLREQQAFSPDKPFFMYWAPGAAHGPHHIMKEWADKYKGKFDDGWDKYRERVFANQKAKGWIPQNAQLTPRPATLPSWDSIPESEKPFQRRLMEVWAGFLAHADYNAGRIIDELKAEGKLDNTLVFYIMGDNGDSAEGQNGAISELLAKRAHRAKQKDIEALMNSADWMSSVRQRPTTITTPRGLVRQHAYKSTKLVAAHFGGTRQNMAVSWPAKIKHDTTPRQQFHHVIDIVPTIYEAAGITPPRVVNGFDQDPINGVSMAYTFADAKAKDRRTTQFFDIMGSRGIYHDGWLRAPLAPHTMAAGIARGAPSGTREMMFGSSTT